MRHIRFGSSLAVAAAAAALLTVGVDPAEPQARLMPRKMPRATYANEKNRKQSRAADRSKKQFLIKGVRP